MQTVSQMKTIFFVSHTSWHGEAGGGATMLGSGKSLN
jgi:hypothetical protein